jgi:O-acetylserine/cysteine efflux transporter
MLTPRDVVLVLITMLIWGLNYVIAKIGLLELPPFALLTMRFALVGILLAPLVPFPRRHVLPLLGFSFVMGPLHFGLVYYGLTRVPAATSAVLVQLQVPFSTVLSYLFLGERPTRAWLLGAALSFAGAVVVLGAPELAGHEGHALLLVLAALMWAVSYMQLKGMHRHGPVHFVSINAWMSLYTAPQIALVSLLTEHDQIERFAAMSTVGWLAMAYQVFFVGILGYAIWYRLIPRYPVNTLSPFTLLIPVISAVAGVVFLGEPVTVRFVLGAGLALAGIGIITTLSRSRPANPAPDTVAPGHTP